MLEKLRSKMCLREKKSITENINGNETIKYSYKECEDLQQSKEDVEQCIKEYKNWVSKCTDDADDDFACGDSQDDCATNGSLAFEYHEDLAKCQNDKHARH